MKEQARRRGQIVDTSFSEGRTVSEMWVHLFTLNEQLALRGERVMDDEDIVAAMLLAFPDRKDSAVFRDVVRVRGRFNRGVLSGQSSRPEQPAFRYKNLNGRPMRVSSHGRPLTEDKQVPRKET